MDTRHETERRRTTDSRSAKVWKSARQSCDSISSDTVELCLGTGLCLWAARRLSRLDLLIGVLGAGLVYRSLARRSASPNDRTHGAAEVRAGLASPGVLVTHSHPSRAIELDRVDEASEESFPGSDPPAFTGTTASPAVPMPS